MSLINFKLDPQIRMHLKFKKIFSYIPIQTHVDLWVLKRTFLMKWFFWATKSAVLFKLIEKKKE